MFKKIKSVALFNMYMIIVILSITLFSYSQSYRWLETYDSSKTIEKSIVPPEGYERLHVSSGSFAEWLRNLPLKDKNAPVYLYYGIKKPDQSVHWRIIDIDVGNEDLQQCADAIIRLRAEYHFSKSEYDSISFNLTSGDTLSFRKWINGIRPEVSGDNVKWIESDKVDSSYLSLREYLRIAFTYAGTYSLSKQLRTKRDLCSIEGGDIFIQGGFPGHAVIVVDVAVNPVDGKRVFLLAQSYMPAQDIHILKNPLKTQPSPWYDCDIEDSLVTPEWIFNKKDLKKF